MKDFKTKNGFFTGNVGIGTTSPGKTLHIAANAHHIALEDTNGTAGSKMVGIYNNNQQLHLGRYSDDNFNGFTTDLFINGSGNVGIGTTNPSSPLGANYSTVEINSGVWGGNIVFQLANYIGNRNSGNDGLAYYAGSGQAHHFSVNGNLSEVMRIDSTGNVGIGTTSPGAQLELYAPTGVVGIRIKSINTETSYVDFADPDDNNPGSIAYYHPNNSMQFKTNDSEKMRITSGGNVGIGVADPKAELHIESNVANHDTTLKIENRQGDTGGTAIEFQGYRDVDNDHWVAKIVADHVSSTAHGSFAMGSNLGFYTWDGSAAATTAPRMTIDQGGNVGIGTTNPICALHVQGTGQPILGYRETTVADHDLFILKSDVGGVDSVKFIVEADGRVGIGTTSPTSGRLDVSQAETSPDACIKTFRPGTADRPHLAFYNGSGTQISIVGDIKTNGSTTSYNTTSDYRLKENVVELTDALDRVCKLKPSRFNFIAHKDKTVDGFLAHEVSSIVPEAVSGEKDVVDDEGNPEYQSIDQSKLIPLLTKAIQEQQTIIEDLKARIETLES